MGKVEVEQLTLVLGHARRLKTLHLVRQIVSEPPSPSPALKRLSSRAQTGLDTTNSTRLLHSGLMDTLLSLPELETLGLCPGPSFHPHLQHRTPLRRFILVEYQVYQHINGRLPLLTELTLDAVSDFSIAWLPRKMLGSLHTLVLSSLSDESTQTIAQVMEVSFFLFSSDLRR